MARRRTDLLGKLADRGEQAIHGVADLPGAERVFDAASSVRDRLDDLQRRVRGVEALEQRVDELERRLDELTRERRALAPGGPPASEATPPQGPSA